MSLSIQEQPELEEDQDQDELGLIRTEPTEGPAAVALPPFLLWGGGLLVAGALFFIGALLLWSSQFPKDTTKRSAYPKPSSSIEVDLSHQGTLLVEYGQQPEASAEPSASPDLAQAPLQAEPQQVLQTAETPETTNSPAAVAPAPPDPPKPVKNSVVQPPALPPLGNNGIQPPKGGSASAKAPAKAPAPSSGYVIYAGPFDSRSAAQSKADLLAEVGQPVKISEQEGKFRLQIGNKFSQQDEAVKVADQVLQHGVEVVIKKEGA